jgi:undecaprenyl-diphosphatase
MLPTADLALQRTSWRLLLVTVLLIIFILDFFGVATAKISGFDRIGTALVRSIGNPESPTGPAWLLETMRDVTALGSTVVVFTIAVVGFFTLMILQRKRAAFLLGVAVAGGELLNTALKHLVDRPRPDFLPGSPHVFTASFQAVTLCFLPRHISRSLT